MRVNMTEHDCIFEQAGGSLSGVCCRPEKGHSSRVSRRLNAAFVRSVWGMERKVKKLVFL